MAEQDGLIHIPPNPEGSTAASGVNARQPKPNRSHVYNRKCQHVRRLGDWLGYYCNRPTKRGKLLCEKHSGKEVK